MQERQCSAAVNYMVIGLVRKRTDWERCEYRVRLVYCMQISVQQSVTAKGKGMGREGVPIQRFLHRYTIEFR